MRFLLILALAATTLSCGPMHPFWRASTPEEQEAEHRKTMDRYEKDLRRSLQEGDIVEVLDPQEVRTCLRVGIADNATHRRARAVAVDRGGDHILAESYRTHELVHVRDTGQPTKEHVVVVPSTQTDYVVYRCGYTFK